MVREEKQQEEYERRRAERDQMYAEMYADPAYKEEQARLKAISASALMDGLETLDFEP